MSKAITFIGGDSRFLYAAQYFEKEGFDVNRIYLNRDSEAKISDTVVLPVPVLRNGFLTAPLHAEKITAEKLFDILPEKSTVYGGVTGELLFSFARKKEINLIDYYKDEALLKENAILTARATLELMRNEKIPVGNGKIFILGNGRCGKALADVLSSVGGNVTVVTGKSSEYSFISFKEMQDYISEASLIINTVPSPVLGEKELKKINKKTSIIEIASAPYGIDFDAAKRLGINVIKAPGLPGKYFPKQAGVLIAKTIIREMNKWQK